MTGVPKYARLENERRFLVLEPPDLTTSPTRPAAICPASTAGKKFRPSQGTSANERITKPVKPMMNALRRDSASSSSIIAAMSERRAIASARPSCRCAEKS